jgi:hypothetical protein
VIPEVRAGKGRMGWDGVSNEAAGGMRVHTQQERDEKMMCVPESLKRLLSYPVMGSGIHKQHAEQHDVPSNASGLGVVDLKSNLWSNLALLNVVEVDIMSRSVDNGKH